jgi:8-oxo-dGTP pyrophosphatase MutT (NUDIX family)
MIDQSPTSLTEQEARERAALIEVDRYDITVDVRELQEGERWLATSSITFRCRKPGAATFVDIVGEVVSARLNDVELDVSSHAAGRLPLPSLADDNVLVVSSVQTDTGSGNAILRSVDPQDKLVYVWSTFEPDGARRAWACFDQPDLKAVHGFQVSAPTEWTVLSNCAPEVVLEHPGAVVILALDDQERVFCLRQYRHPARMRMLELPAGLLDVEGEEPRATAERELLEEAGLEASDWVSLGSAYSSPGISSEQIHYFLARGLRQADRGDFTPAHEEADMDTLWVPYAELLAACLDGRVRDAPVLIAVLTARQQGLIGNDASDG